MANTAHKNMPDSQLHEVKGAATAAAGKMPIANGTGLAPFSYANPIGATSFINNAVPFSMTSPTVYTKVNPVTTALGVAIEVTEGTNARLTYTGTRTSIFKINAVISLLQSTGSNKEISVKLYKNSTAIAHSEVIQTTSTAITNQISLNATVSLATNDFIECYIITESGDLFIKGFYLDMIGIRG